MSDKSSLLKGVGSGLATYARMKSVIGAIVATVVIIVLVLIGRALIKTKYSADTMLVVTSVGFVPADLDDGSTPAPGSCSPIVNENNVSYQCIVSGDYEVGGKALNAKNLNYSGKSPVTPGQSLKVFYDPRNPNDVVIQKIASKTIGWVLIAIATVIGLITILGTIFVFSSKGYATIEGGVGAASSLSSAIFGHRRRR